MLMQYKPTKPEAKLRLWEWVGAERGQRDLAFLDHILQKLPFETILKVINEL